MKSLHCVNTSVDLKQYSSAIVGQGFACVGLCVHVKVKAWG